MNVQDIVKFLRDSILVQDPNIVVVDPDYLAITDEDFVTLLQVCLSKVDSEDNIFNLSSDNLYELILVAKKELYHRLAMKTATKYSLTSATGVQLKRSEIFEHYYQLIEEVEKEYRNYKSTGTTVKQGEILISSRYFTQRNFDLATKPSVALSIDEVYLDKVELSWKLTRINKFAKYTLYLSKSPIVDKYKNNTISNKATKVCDINNIHTTCYRIEDLEPNTKYYVVILVEEKNGLQGYTELFFTTL